MSSFSLEFKVVVVVNEDLQGPAPSLAAFAPIVADAVIADKRIAAVSVEGIGNAYVEIRARD